MNDDIPTLKAKLEELRASNRKMSMQNIILKAQVQDATEEIKKFNEMKSSAQNENEFKKKKMDEDMDRDGNQQAKLRIERRKLIMADIHKFTEENKAISDSIKEMNDKLSRAKFDASRKQASEQARKAARKAAKQKRKEDEVGKTEPNVKPKPAKKSHASSRLMTSTTQRNPTTRKSQLK